MSLPGGLTPFAADSGFAADGMRHEPAEFSVSEDVLLVPPLPLKPTVSPLVTIQVQGEKE